MQKETDLIQNSILVFTMICPSCKRLVDCPIPIGQFNEDEHSTCGMCDAFLGYFKLAEKLGKTKEQLEKENGYE